MANSPALIAEDTQTMSLINHNTTIILVLQLDNFRQFGQISFHGEYTINDDKLNSVVGEIFQHPLQIFHVVVLGMELSGETQSSSVYNACMVTVIANNVITSAYHHS